MVAKIHPEPLDLNKSSGESADHDGKTKTENGTDNVGQKEGDHGSSPTADPVEFINNCQFSGSLLEPPKSPSKPRQRGIGLENLRVLSYLQIRQTNRYMEDFANVQNNYDIEKSDKQVDKVFYGMECTAPEVRAKVQSSTNASQPFALKLIDRDDGSELLEINRNGLNEVPTLVYKLRLRRKEPCGAIALQFGWTKLSPTFTVFDHNGNPLMKAVGPAAASGLGKVVVAKESAFTVYRVGDGDTKVGSIVKDGDIFQQNQAPTTKEEIIRVNFDDKSLDDLSKALILCVAFVLDYTQFKQPSNFQKVASLLCFKCT
ncbi:Phospholipid scramblase 3 [Folsomia candida]|uniref:Phospholipid scramblase n=1 Tax=Folsomia candida TaxID=158441 RepID=A0A226ENC9_FOLCA|nr:Phospholipid scramblase 3 [Folsomia candida]